jgi:hypothetical protein
MKLLTQTQIKQLLVNGSDQNAGKDHKPVVKLFLPGTAATWLLTELLDNNDIAFGLCDLGHGFPELGYVSLSEITSVTSPLGLTVEKDISFYAEHPLSVYARAARIAQEITENETALEQASQVS